MRSVNSILTHLALSLLLASCTTIPNIRFYKEIPFLDAPEGVYVDSLTHQQGTIDAKKWGALRPYMIMIDPEGIVAIKGEWDESCRKAGLMGGKCNAALDSFGDVIKVLDGITKNVIAPQLGP